MKKKLLKFSALAMAMAIFASGCGGDTEAKETNSTTVSAVETSNDSKPVADSSKDLSDKNPDKEETEKVIAPVDEEKQPEAMDEEKQPEVVSPVDEEVTTTKAKPLAVGKIENNVYTNEYIGIKCAFAPGWEAITRLSMDTLINNMDRTLSLGELSALYSDPDGNYFCDMNVQYLRHTDENGNPIFLTEDEVFSVFTDEYINTLFGNVEDMVLEDAYVTNVTFLGKNHKALFIKGYTNPETMGAKLDIYNLQLCNYELGEYGVTITIGSVIEDKTQELLAMFEPL